MLSQRTIRHFKRLAEVEIPLGEAVGLPSPHLESGGGSAQHRAWL